MDSKDSSKRWAPMGIGSKCVYCDHAPDDAASTIKDPIHYHPSALCMQLLFCIMHYLKWYKNILLKNKPLVLCLTPGLQNVMSWIIHNIRVNVIIFSSALSLSE